MIVVDTNILVYLYLPSEHTENVEALLGQTSTWSAPLLWKSELRNVLTGYVRRKTLTLDQAKNIQKQAENLLAGAEFEIDSNMVFDLVAQSDCSAYDCEFVALAVKLNTRLVTMDKKILRAFPQHSVDLTTI